MHSIIFPLDENSKWKKMAGKFVGYEYVRIYSDVDNVNSFGLLSLARNA